MRIVDEIRPGHPVFSFEFFPPKTRDGEENLWSVLSELRALRPSFVSVTYGAGGSTQAKTVEITRRIKSELGIEAMAHLTCVGATERDLRVTLDGLAEAGVRNVLALRGDPPRGSSGFVATAGGFKHAYELIQLIRRHYDFCVGAACYPEGHPEAPSKHEDLRNLRNKVDAGVDFLVTQLFFDNQLYFDFVDRARAAGIHVPIIPGIMPVQNVDQIKRFTAMCGASLPVPFLAQLEQRAEQPERVQELGIVYAALQCLGLIQGGSPGVHFYTLNRSSSTRDILAAIRMHGRV